MYHNTTNETERLAEYDTKAKTQDEIVYELFKIHKELTPSQAYKLFRSDLTPLTSIRRSISNLTKEDRLERTEMKKDGIYGRKEYVWKLKTYEPYQTNLLDAISDLENNNGNSSGVCN